MSCPILGKLVPESRVTGPLSLCNRGAYCLRGRAVPSGSNSTIVIQPQPSYLVVGPTYALFLSTLWISHVPPDPNSTQS